MMMGAIGESPKMFRIGDPTDTIKAFRVSKDAVIAAAVMGNDEIHIYRLFDAKGEFLGDKKATFAPVNKMKIRDPELTNVVDLQIHKRHTGVDATSPAEYFLYVISTNGILLYQHIEKRDDCKPLNDDFSPYTLTPNCTDLNSQGVLLVDAAMKQATDAATE